MTLRQTPTENGTQPHYDVRTPIGEGASAAITLDRQTYTLRITRAGKLILAK